MLYSYVCVSSFESILQNTHCYLQQHGGAAGKITASQPHGPYFKPKLWLLSVQSMSLAFYDLLSKNMPVGVLAMLYCV